MKETQTDSRDCICRAVRSADRLLTNAYDQALAPSGLRTTQYTLLSVLEREDVASISQLSELLELDQSTTTRNVRLLEESGLISRVPHHDPRVKLLKVTSKGKQKRKVAFGLWQEIQTQMMEILSKDELNTFRNVLNRVSTLSKTLV